MHKVGHSRQLFSHKLNTKPKNALCEANFHIDRIFPIDRIFLIDRVFPSDRVFSSDRVFPNDRFFPNDRTFLFTLFSEIIKTQNSKTL